MKLCFFVACTAALVGCSDQAASPGAASGGAGQGGFAGNASVSGAGGGAGQGGSSAVGGAGGSAAGAGGGGMAGAGLGGVGGVAGAGGAGGSAGAEQGPGAAAPLQGLTLQVACGAEANQMRSCSYVPPGDQDCQNGQVRTYAKVMATMGGTPGTTYEVKLRFRGIIEANEYTGGTSDNNGFYEGGTPGGQGGQQYSQYSLETSSPSKVYHLNQLDPGAQQDKFKNPSNGGVVHHFGFIIDYIETVSIEGGATVSLLGKDNDCFMGRNCQPPANDFGKCTLQSVPDVPVTGQPFDGNFIYLDVVSATPAK